MIKNLAIGGGSNRALLILALFLGGLAAVLTGVYLNDVKGNGGSFSGAVVPVVVASADIAANTRITAEMVTLKEVPDGTVLANAFTDAEVVVGKVTQVPIVAGEQILPAKVSATGVELTQFKGEVPLSLTMPQGKRGFSIQVSEIGAAGGLIRAGDYVDVILSQETVSAPDSSQTTTTACYAAQDVQVLAVAQNLVQRSESGEGNTGVSTTTSDSTAVSATLAASPHEAVALAAAQKSVSQNQVGRQLWVSLRPYGEHGQVGTLPICGVIPGA